jgi:nucleotide-binding universal stress UspA family protein
MHPLRHLVVGTDFSHAAESALDFAIRLAVPPHSRITVIHVCELSAERGLPEYHVTPAFDDELLWSCHRSLEAAVARRAGCGVELVGVLRTGKPWEKINNIAAEVGASVIVLGRSGAGGEARFLGSVADRVVRTASRPVLTVASDHAHELARVLEARP